MQNATNQIRKCTCGESIHTSAEERKYYLSPCRPLIIHTNIIRQRHPPFQGADPVPLGVRPCLVIVVEVTVAIPDAVGEAFVGCRCAGSHLG